MNEFLTTIPESPILVTLYLSIQGMYRSEIDFISWHFDHEQNQLINPFTKYEVTLFEFDFHNKTTEPLTKK